MSSDMLDRTDTQEWERVEGDDPDGLPALPGDRKSMFIRAYAECGSTSVASRKIGVPYHTAYSWTRETGFAACVYEARSRLIQTTGASVAYAALLRIVTRQDENGEFRYPVAEVRRAARDILDMAGHTRQIPQQAQQVAALHELSEDQLTAHIAAARAVLEHASRPADPPDPPDVAPNPGRSSALL